MMENEKPFVLIVDDVVENLKVLATILWENNCDVAMADTVSNAREILKTKKPTLILLDVMMPEIDGFSFCKELKANPQFKDIPVIFLTAKQDNQSIIQGFKVGGIDYLTKPFNKEELLVRIKNHISLRMANQKIFDYANQLEKLMKERDEFFDFTVHDLKNPLNSVNGYLDLTLQLLKSDDFDKNKIIGFLNNIKQSSQKMLETITKILDFEKLDSSFNNLNLEYADITDIIKEVIDRNSINAIVKNIDIYHTDLKNIKAYIDKEKFTDMFENLLSNAIKYSNPYGRIEIKIGYVVKDNKNYFKLAVKDYGQGMTEDDKKNLFEQFQTLSAKPTGGEISTGLGLAIVKKIVDLHNGLLEVVSEQNQGSEFIVYLPIQKNSDIKIENTSNLSKYKLSENLSENIQYDVANDKSNYDINDDEKIILANFANKAMYLANAMLINDIEKFVADLEKTNTSMELDFLDKFLKDMKLYIQNFDIQSLKGALRKFSSTVQEILKQT